MEERIDDSIPPEAPASENFCFISRHNSLGLLGWIQHNIGLQLLDSLIL